MQPSGPRFFTSISAPYVYKAATHCPGIISTVSRTTDRHPNAVSTIRKTTNRRPNAISTTRKTTNRHPNTISTIRRTTVRRPNAISTIRRTTDRRPNAISTIRRTTVRCPNAPLHPFPQTRRPRPAEAPASAEQTSIIAQKKGAPLKRRHKNSDDKSGS